MAFVTWSFFDLKTNARCRRRLGGKEGRGGMGRGCEGSEVEGDEDPADGARYTNEHHGAGL